MPLLAAAVLAWACTAARAAAADNTTTAAALAGGGVSGVGGPAECCACAGDAFGPKKTPERVYACNDAQRSLGMKEGM